MEYKDAKYSYQNHPEPSNTGSKSGSGGTYIQNLGFTNGHLKNKTNPSNIDFTDKNNEDSKDKGLLIQAKENRMNFEAFSNFDKNDEGGNKNQEEYKVDWDKDKY
ncbi:hypothetical protein ABK040_010759 [Willaertia magna]